MPPGMFRKAQALLSESHMMAAGEGRGSSTEAPCEDTVCPHWMENPEGETSMVTQKLDTTQEERCQVQSQAGISSETPSQNKNRKGKLRLTYIFGFLKTLSTASQGSLGSWEQNAGWFHIISQIREWGELGSRCHGVLSAQPYFFIQAFCA